jgi:hypothetical protein
MYKFQNELLTGVEAHSRCSLAIAIYSFFADFGRKSYRKETLGGSLVGKQTALT